MAGERDLLDDLQVLERIFGPIMGKVLSEHLDTPVFFLTLHPTQWSLQYFAETSGREAGQVKLSEQISPHVEIANQDWDIAGLDSLLRTLSTRSDFDRLSDTERFDAAACQLSSETLALGSIAPPEGDGGEPESGHNWIVRGRNAAPLRWFQHTLDFAHVHRFDPERLPQQLRGRLELDRQRQVLTIKEYMSEPRLVDRDSFQFYLAEYVYSRGGRIPAALDEEDLPSRLHHFFLPLAGLGQWRAAACWVASPAERRQRRPAEIDTGFRESIQALFSQALVDTFGASLDWALAQGTAKGGHRESIYKTFATLWWLDELACFDGGQCVARLGRTEAGAVEFLASLETELAPLANGTFLAVDSQLGRSTVQLDFRELAGVDLNLARRILGCDVILVSIRLFERDQQKLVESVYGNRIRDRLSLSLRLHSLQQSATRAETVEAVGHSMKSTVKVTGWHNALKKLQKVEGPGPEISEAIRCLSLYVLVEGVGGLLRLVSLSEQGDFGKIGAWTTPLAIEQWYSADGELLDRYVRFIRKFVVLICCGLNWREGFKLLVDGRGEEVVSTTVPPLGSIEDWTLVDRSLAPLSAVEGPDAHIAMLSALIEPVCNAVKNLVALQRQGRYCGLYVWIGAQFPSKIVVNIGNDTSQLPYKTPPGLTHTMDLFQYTDLATIREGASAEHPWARVGSLKRYWVTVELHPIRLAEKIQRMVAGGSKR